MAAGLKYCDRALTVSPSYAVECCTDPEKGDLVTVFLGVGWATAKSSTMILIYVNITMYTDMIWILILLIVHLCYVHLQKFMCPSPCHHFTIVPYPFFV